MKNGSGQLMHQPHRHIRRHHDVQIHEADWSQHQLPASVSAAADG